ncbi:MAG TPA: Ig-like domain-containing protein, partial [Gracilimonas sp.]|uniref:Ig-like domain-containing protein n=1 Tax=Gracilimonas sp. TaxID=1974203 RepID=UPI002D89AB01|nr:Ig-like domain-containing protein [Gracilimonas sp.]
MNTLCHPSFFAGNGMVHNIRKLWVLLILFSFLALTSGCNESGLTNAGLFLEIISTTPAADADNVPVNTSISVTFSESMDSTSINENTFIVKIDTVSISGTLSYSDPTAVFKPSSPLGYGSTYHVVISSDVEDTLGNNLKNNFEWSFKTIEQEATPPQIQSVNPADEERDVPVDVVISASFSEALDDASVNSSTFMISQNGNSVSGSIGLSGSTVSFTPNNDLPYEAEVKAVITTGVKDGAGNSLPANYEWSFVIMDEPDNTPPQIQSVNPSDDERDVSVDMVISASFSEALDDASVNSSTFMISQNGNSVSGSINLSGSTISFTPNNDLPYEAVVTAVITTGVKDEAGNSLPANYEWSFVIMDEPDNISPEVISTSPADNARDVDVDSDITATFSEPMNESSISNSTIIVTRQGRTVSGSVSYSDNTVTFNPDGDLRDDRTYRVTITTGVEDLAGNALENDVTWTFRTEDDDDDDD